MAELPKKQIDFEKLYRKLEALPHNKVGQIINDVLHTNPKPSGPHCRAASALGMDIGSPFDRGNGGPGGWWIIRKPALHLNQQVLVPDIAGWRQETMPKIPEGHRFTVPPDWVCEVLSPSSAKTDRIKKMPMYAEAGVGYLWLVDPLAHTLETYALTNDNWTLTGSFKDDDKVDSAV